MSRLIIGRMPRASVCYVIFREIVSCAEGRDHDEMFTSEREMLLAALRVGA